TPKFRHAWSTPSLRSAPRCVSSYALSSRGRARIWRKSMPRVRRTTQRMDGRRDRRRCRGQPRRATLVPRIPPRMDDLSATDDLSGTVVGDRYAIERAIGRGGMATVWLARDAQHARMVAIKTLHPDLAGAIGVDRFVREVRLTARLQHPSIAPILD